MPFGGTPYNGTGISRDQFKSDTTKHWPELPSGLPVKIPDGVNPMLKGDDVEDLPIELKANSKMFQLWLPEDKLEFDRVNNFFANRIYYRTFRSEQWNPEQNHFRVWMEWVEGSHVIPEAIRR
jgi:hypothetical protein